MRIVKDPDIRKQEILEGALRVFARKGYDKTTITDIAKELGISQGLCYRYYASKEEIYDVALETYAEYIVNSNMERFNLKGMTFKERIMTFSGGIEEYRSPEKDDDLLYELFHGGQSQKMHDQLMMKVSEKLVPHIVGTLNEAKKCGEINISDTDTFAYFFVYGQLGMILSKGKNADCGKKIQDCLIELLNL